MENKGNQIVENEKEEKKGYGCIYIMVGIGIAVILLGIFIFYFSSTNKTNSNFNNTNNDTAIISPFKEPPTLSSEQNFSSIMFNIQCNDNYSYVILHVEFIDKNGNKIKNFTLRENNMKRGELRQVEYKLSLSEIFDVKQYTYGVIECM